MTRFWAEGLPVVVQTYPDAAPQAFHLPEQPRHQVQVMRRWRRDVGWWRKRVWREYFLVRTDRGLLLELYHDVVAGEWRIQRIYD